MILQKLFFNLIIIVWASKTNKTRKRPYDCQNYDQMFKLDEISIEEKPLDSSSKKKNYIPSSHLITPVYPNFNDNERMERFFLLFDNLSFNTLRLLNSMYSIYGKKLIPLNEWFELKGVGKIKNPIEKYIDQFEKNDLIVLNRFSKINDLILKHFQKKKIRLSDLNIGYYIDIVFMDLRDELKNANVSSLINSLFVAVKDFGSDKFFGFISLVLFMLSSDFDGQKLEIREFLVYSIVFFRCLLFKRCQTNRDIELSNSWELKSKLYKMILKCFFPSSYEIEYKRIFHFLHNNNEKNKWFNEPQVFLLLFFINTNSIPELFFLYGNFNDVKNMTDITTKNLCNAFYKDMKILYRIEYILMKNSRILNIKFLNNY